MIDEQTIDDTPGPDVAPKSARAWLAAITSAEKAFEDYQHRSDSIDKLYANLRHLASATRDREFQMFWANIEVLGPSIYARPPVPVVTPKFKDRRPLYRASSEVLERSVIVTFDMNDINSVMMLLRDDLTINARGVPWVRYETADEGEYSTERLCLEHLDRKDFVHEPARKWSEVGWVARRGWMSRKAMRKRFRATSGDAYASASFEVRKDDKDNGAADNSLKAGVWEIWSKDQKRVVWVAEGVDVLLDDDKPHLRLEGFFPCPKPAYGTLQRRSLVPVPDMVYYKDQLEEINELTGRISALASAVQVRGFYPAGAGEIGDAIESALKTRDNRHVMVPISNWAAFGGGAAKDTIVWLPIDMIVTTIAQLVDLRRQVIDDVYQIMGLSDIMRGTTDASETLGAQQIKAQYGSVRIRNKQMELVRVARDLVRIVAEIMAENFEAETLLSMSQMEIPSDADIQGQIEQLTQQAEQQYQQMVQQALQTPEAQQMVRENPAQAQQMAQQAQQQIMGQVQPQVEKLQQTVTIEQVMKFLRDERTRPFVLDIETDSTIQPDEDAEKQRRNEFLQALAGSIQQLGGLVQMEPAAAPMAAQILKFAMAPYRAGRELEGAIEEFAEAMAQKASQPQPNPEAEAAKAEQEMKQAEMQARQQEAQAQAAADAQRLQMEQQAAQVENAERAQALQVKQQEAAAKDQERQAELAAKERLNQISLAAAEEARANAAQQHAQAMQKGSLDIALANAKLAQAGIDLMTPAPTKTLPDGSTAEAPPVPDAEAVSRMVERFIPSERREVEEGQSALQTIAQGQAAMAEAIAMLANSMNQPKVVRTPDGRVYTSAPMAN